jgi:hypothetical protein
MGQPNRSELINVVLVHIYVYVFDLKYKMENYSSAGKCDYVIQNSSTKYPITVK